MGNIVTVRSRSADMALAKRVARCANGHRPSPNALVGIFDDHHDIAEIIHAFGDVSVSSLVGRIYLLTLTKRGHKLIQGCSAITKIMDSSHGHVVTNSHLRKLGSLCKNLDHLNLGGCYRITDEGVASLAATCDKLIHLALGGCYRITDDGVASLAATCDKLIHLNLGGCYRITDEGVASLAATCDKLIHLDL